MIIVEKTSLNKRKKNSTIEYQSKRENKKNIVFRLTTK